MSLVLDFGSTNTVLRERGANRTLATALAVDRQTGKTVAVGDQASRMDGRAAERFEVIYPVARGVVADLKMARRFLREFLKQTLSWRQRKLYQFLLVVPSGLSRLEVRAFVEALRWAGARTCRVVDRSLSIALAAGIPPDPVQGVMVVDIGGQTTEAAALCDGRLIVSRRSRVGGMDLTQAIRRGLHQHRQLEVGLHEAEAIKRSVASASLDHSRRGLAHGRDSGTGMPRAAVVHSKEVHEWMKPVLVRLQDEVRAALDQLPPELAADLADREVLLSGGGSLVAGMEDCFRKGLGLRVRRLDAALTAAVEGAQHIPPRKRRREPARWIG